MVEWMMDGVYITVGCGDVKKDERRLALGWILQLDKNGLETGFHKILALQPRLQLRLNLVSARATNINNFRQG